MRESAPANRSNSVRPRNSAGAARYSQLQLSLQKIKRAAPIRYRPFLILLLPDAGQTGSRLNEFGPNAWSSALGQALSEV